jgi:hypothetical protein
VGETEGETDGGRRPGKNPNLKEFGDDKVDEGEVFWPEEECEIELGDAKVPYGLWRAI